MERLVELGRLMDAYGDFLTKRQRNLMEQSVNEDCSLSEIAEREGISRQGVRDALKKAEAQLAGMEARLHLLAIEDGLQELLDRTPASMQAELKRLLNLCGGGYGI